MKILFSGNFVYRDAQLILSNELQKIFNSCDFRICNFETLFILTFSTDMTVRDSINIKKGEGFITCTFNKLPLQKGNYYVTMFLEINGVIADWINARVPMSVEDGDFYGIGRNSPGGGSFNTLLYDHKWIL
jgi:hypothetical protein